MRFRRTQIWANQRLRQDVHLFARVFRDFTLFFRIRQNQFFLHCVFQRLIQHHMNALHHARTQPVFFQLRLVLLLHTAVLEQLVVKLLNLQHCQLFQLHISELRNDVVVNGVVVKLSGRVSHLRLDVDGIPELQPLFECITASLHRIELLAVLNRGTQLVLDLRLRSAKHIFRDHLPVCIVFSCLGFEFPTPLISPKEHQKERCGHFRSQRSFITFHGALRNILLSAGFPAMFRMITIEQTFVNGPLPKISLADASESNRFYPCFRESRDVVSADIPVC